MSPKKHFQQFWTAFSHPKVFLFIALGAGVIFLTFLTDNNALEIAISGFASFFIGIGVNNFSSFETSLKDSRRLESYLHHSKEMLGMMRLKAKTLQSELANEKDSKMKAAIEEIEQLVALHISFLEQVSMMR
ncbi:MAG TPA: hypothetical protein VFP87_05330 [Chitinophagaceae bacterium]|nr:hypothetical protein [Chitinophagaceae bacterium]